MGRLDGKVAVITGATSGIGLRTAEIFVAEGAKIVIAGRRAPEGEALAKKLGANCIFRQTDVTVEEQMRALIGPAVEKFGRIDCLFNNAGGPAQTGGIEGLEVDRFDAAMATLVRSVMLGMKHAAPHMRRQGSGSIINNGSIAGRLAGFSSSVVYGAAKAAVIHLTKCVAMELGESGIRVNSISPGAIATGIFGKALGLSVEAAEKTPDVMREVYKTAQPIPRAGLPEDIAHAAVFLASDESSFINGHDLVVDGAITGGRNWTAQQQGYVAMRKAFDQGKGLNARLERNLRLLAVVAVASAAGGVIYVFARGFTSPAGIASGIVYGLILGVPLASISLFVLQGPMRGWLGSLSFTADLMVRSAIYAAIIVPIQFFQLGDRIAGTPLDPSHKNAWIATGYSVAFWSWRISFSGSPTSSGRARS